MAAKEELCWCGWLRTNGKAHTHNPNFDDGFIPVPTAVPSRDEDKSNTTQQNKCCGCSEAINTDNDDYGWSTTKSDYLCAVCRDMDESSSSVMMVTTNGQTAKYFIGEHLRVNEHGDEISEPDWLITRQWVKSDDYRGFYNTLVDGWTTVLEGWTTGNWDDSTGQRKRKFNEWAESIHDGEIIPPVQIAIIADPTSNIFSMGMSVLTPDPIGFKEWLGSELSELQNSLL